jgi:hypothetical protein
MRLLQNLDQAVSSLSSQVSWYTFHLPDICCDASGIMSGPEPSPSFDAAALLSKLRGSGQGGKPRAGQAIQERAGFDQYERQNETVQLLRNVLIAMFLNFIHNSRVGLENTRVGRWTRNARAGNRVTHN